MTLTIPRSFGPVAKTNSRGVIIYASSPLFEPLKTHPKFGASMSPKQISAFVEIDFGMTGFLATRLHKDDDSYLVENVGAEVGLNKRLVWYQPGTELPLNRGFNDYFDRSPNGEIETLITCDTHAEADCLHSFYRKGWTYTFHHRREFLGDWKEMQNRLSALAESFVISGAAVSFRTERLFASNFVHKVDSPRCSGKVC